MRVRKSHLYLLLFIVIHHPSPQSTTICVAIPCHPPSFIITCRRRLSPFAAFRRYSPLFDAVCRSPSLFTCYSVIFAAPALLDYIFHILSYFLSSRILFARFMSTPYVVHMYLYILYNLIHDSKNSSSL